MSWCPPTHAIVTAKPYLVETMFSSDIEVANKNKLSTSGEDVHMAAVLDYKEPCTLYEDFWPRPLSYEV